MKAIIMAGGEGTRLRPVSEGMPKPMTPLMDKPVLARIFELLEKNGVAEACLTLRFMPQTIIDYIEGGQFGIKVHTRTEQTPLGTAGGVRACSDFISGSDFLVISGDCVCDFDLKAVMDFHKEKKAEATIALYEHPEPLEYGLVVTRADGRIAQFIEKPPWEGVVTNKINTGIYVLSSSVLADIPPDKPYDFGKELFPLLLNSERGLYGVAAEGYWCDIGSPEAYRGCCMDILDGKASIGLSAPQLRKGVWSLSPLPETVIITPPVYIGQNVQLRPGASVGPGAVIGSGSLVAPGASVSDCVINGASVLDNASVTGAVVCKSAVIGRGASVRENAVVGEGCSVGDNAVIAEAVKIWPDRQIPAGMLIKNSITHGMLKSSPSFTARGVISGRPGSDLTVAGCMSLGEAAAAFKRVGVGWQGGEAARVMAEAIGCGVCAEGGELTRFDSGLASCASFFGFYCNMPLTICVSQDDDRLSITFFGKNGGLLPHEMERKLLGAPVESHPFCSMGQAQNVCGIFEAYAASAARYACESGGRLTGAAAVFGSGVQNRALKRALELLGFTITGSRAGAACFEAGADGTELRAIDENGRGIDSAQMLVLTAAIEIERGRRELAVPYDAPSVLEGMAERGGAVLFRLGRDGEYAERLFAEIPSMRDGIYAGALINAYMSEAGVTLSSLIDNKTPKFAQVTRELNLKRGRGEVMSVLSASACEAGADLSSGIRLAAGRGSVLISPLRGKSAIRLRIEAANEEIAEELCGDFIARAKAANLI